MGEKVSQRVFEEEAAKFQDALKDPDWRLVEKVEHTEVWRKSEDASPIQIVKIANHLTGVPYKDAIKLLTDYKLRQEYDKTITELKILDNCGYYETIYSFYKLPESTWDAVFYSFVKEEGGATYVITLNAEHADAPVRPDVKRSDIKMAGIMIKQDDNDPNSSMLFSVSHMDLKKSNPLESVVKLANAWREAIVSFYQSSYCKK